MNKAYLIKIFISLTFLLPFFGKSQCVVCVEAPALITCGESATLTGDGFLTSIYEGNFNSGIGPLWNLVSPGGVTNSTCSPGPGASSANCAGAGVVPAGDFLWFPPGAAVPRQAQTIPIPVPTGGTIVFQFKMEQQSGSCDGPDLIGEGIMLQYNTGSGWTDVQAAIFPFTQNPMPYTNKAYFCPTNPNLQSFTSWNQYQIPIPVAAYSANTQFRWIQTSPTSAQWDFWGLDNINIVPSSPGGATYSWTPGGNGQSIVVSPTSLTNYTFTYTDGGISCSTTVAVDVAPPVVNPVIVPNPLNPCPNAVDLTANCSFNSCNYNIYLYDNGGDGWITVPQTPTSIDNRLEVYIDGILANTITMNDLSGGPNPNGPVVYSFPVTAGGTFETVFLSGGPNPSECAYFVEDNQGNLISAQGLITSPNSPFWPVPSSISWPSGGFTVVPGNVGPISTTCPTVTPYTYSWSISPGGSTAGISSPNSQSTTVTTASTQNYEVIATDVNNPGCIATGIVAVVGSGGSWDFTNISPNPACAGDCIDLNFTSTVGSGNYNVVIELIDDNGTNSYTFTIDPAGNNIATGSPINLCPVTSSAVPNATFNITSLVDASDPNNCEIPITNASQIVSFSSLPNAGTAPLTPITICTLDPIVDLSTYLSNSPDLGGTWTYTGGGPAPANMPFVGLNYILDPATSPAGNYIYTASNAPCINDISTISINLETPPFAGQLPPVPTNICMGQSLDLNTLFISNPTPFTPTWTDISSGVPGVSISSNFTPSSSGNYTLRNTISATANCPADIEDVNIVVNDLPTVTLNTINQICLGENLTLTLNLTGTAPFTITITDNINPPFNVQADINGNDFATGNPITVTPVNTGIITYTITSISDNFCTTTISGQSSIVNVLTPPNSGVLLSALSVCSNDLSIYDLSNQLLGQDLTGYWIDASGFQQPPNPSFNFNTSMTSGNYTYIVESSACPDAQTIVPVSIINEPNTGTANPQSICINDYNAGNLYNLDNLLTGNPDPGMWMESGIPIPTNINPNTYGVGTTTFTYEVNGIPPCSNESINVDLTINPEPVINSFTSSAPSTTQGYSIDLIANMSAGSPPFTIDLFDDDSPINQSTIFIATGNTGQVSVFPNVIPNTTYFISLITDGNGCTTNYNGSVPVGVIPYPIIDPFYTLTPEICENDVATIEFNMPQGVVPVTIDYTLNGNPYTEILNSTGITSVVIPNSNLNFGINNFSITSIIDVNNEPAPNIPNDIQIIYNPNPIANFSTTTPVICFEDDAILEFDFLAGSPPFTVNYTINSVIGVPSLLFNGMGTQTQVINPDPSVGTNTFGIINIIDNEGCIGNITTTSDILVHELPDLDLTISGNNPICVGDISNLSFPVLAGTAPFNLNILEGATSVTLNVDALGLINGQVYDVSPTNTTNYSLISVSDANGCSKSLSDTKILTVNEIPIVDVSGTNEICFEDITQLYFNFSAGLSPWTLSYDIDGIPAASFPLSNQFDSISISPATTSVYTFNTLVDANNCTHNFTDAITITVNQLPEVSISGGGEICDDGSTVDVIINTSSGTPTFNIEYTVGISNRIASNIGYQYVLATNEAGIYNVTSITDSKGCIGKDINGTAEVIINPVPIANFSAYPQPADITNPVINFIDNSTGHINGTWDFDDNSTATTNFGKITHRFSDIDSGTYFVELYVESNKGCYSIDVQKIVIDKAFIFYIPNAFSPNRDMINDTYKPYVDGVKEYQFKVFSRTGQKIFETNDPNIGWDGYIDNNDNFALSGKYAYSIEIVDLHGKKRNYRGSFLLIR